jgi:hypothetical protein
MPTAGSMPATYTIILRDCPQASRNGVALFLGKAFSLKESTCAAIASSAPIILVSALAREEAAAMSLTLSGLSRLGGILEFTTADQGDLPKIDWPKRPLVFKREISEHLEDLQTEVPTTEGKRRPLIDFLVAGLSGQTVTVSGDEEPDISVEIKPASRSAQAAPVANKFEHMALPEITPFSSPASQPAHPTPPPGASRSDDPAARLGELFPEDDQAGFVPNNEDITNILDRLLPEDDSPSTTARAGTASSSRRPPVPAAANPGGGYSVFLAKIADEARRTKAAELIAELAKITKDEADNLSKKVIIPVLKGASKDEAEAAKQRFAKIGILARVKGPE